MSAAENIESTNAAPEETPVAPTADGAVVPEMLCGECELVMAGVYCNECHEQYCKSCTNSVHSKGRRKLHSDFTKLFACGECADVFSTVECSQCKETFCEPCCKKVHSKGQRREKINLHKFLPLDVRNLQLANHEQSNAFGILRSELHWQRFTGLGGAEGSGVVDPDTAAAVNESEECEFRVSMLDVETQELFRDTLCTLSPDQPVPLNLLSTGTDDESVQRVEEQRLRRQDSFDARTTLFGDEMGNFACWRRISDLSNGEGALFCYRSHATQHAYPESLLVMPEKDGTFSGNQKKKDEIGADGTSEGSPATPTPAGRQRKGDPNASILTQCNSTAALTTSAFRFMGFVPSFQKCSLADNFVLLAVAAVMTNRQAFTDLFASCEHLNQGMVTLRFFDTPRRFVQPDVSPRRVDGTIPGSEVILPPPTPQARFVTIDTLVPCSQQGPVNNQLAVGRTDHEAEFGVGLLEKAYATFVGSYARLHHGRVDRVLEHFTRGEATFLRWTREEGTRLSAQGIAQLLWYLQEATLLRLPMVATDTLNCHSMEGTANASVPPLHNPLRNELFAQHGDTSAADFDWCTGSVVHFSLDYHQPSESVLPMEGRQSPVPANCNRTPRTSNTSRHHAHRRTDVAKTWHLVKTQRLYDEAECFAEECDLLDSPDEASAEARPFSEMSPYWTKHARKTLNHFAVDTKLKWETIEDFATSHDSLLLMRNTYLSPDASIHFSAIPHSIRPHNMALHLPHFLLAVGKIDDTLDEAGTLAGATIKTDFTNLAELVPPEMNLGEESDDDVDPMSRSTSSRASSANKQLLPTASQALQLQFRVSFPAPPGDHDSYVPVAGRNAEESAKAAQPSYRSDNLTVMVYRVPEAHQQKCVMTEVEGKPTASLPTHSRVSVNLVSTTENEMLFQMEANTGFYNVVVVPDANCFPFRTDDDSDVVPGQGTKDPKTGEELNNFVYSITSIKRQNGDAYNVGFCPL